MDIILILIAVFLIVSSVFAYIVSRGIRLGETDGRDPRDCRPRDGMEW